MAPTDDRRQNPVGRWYCTFGWDHTDPRTGESLRNRYVVLDGDIESTRTEMLRRFGNRWSMQYASADEAGVDRFGLTEYKLAPAVLEGDR